MVLHSFESTERIAFAQSRRLGETCTPASATWGALGSFLGLVPSQGGALSLGCTQFFGSNGGAHINREATADLSGIALDKFRFSCSFVVGMDGETRDTLFSGTVGSECRNRFKVAGPAERF